MSRYTSRYEGGYTQMITEPGGTFAPGLNPLISPMYLCIDVRTMLCSLAKTGLPSFCPMLLVLLQFYVFAQIHAYVTIITMVYVRIAIFPKSRATNVRNMSGTVGAWAATM